MSLERAEKSIPLVSIVIITYQQANFVVEAIESALAQDYGHTEIIIADDSSTDGTQDILKQYQAKFPDRIILILSQINGGITANSNAALTRCTGKYIAWLGGDDIMFKSRISKQIKALEENPHWAFVYSSMVVLDNHTKKEVGMLPTSGFSTKTINASLDLIFGGQNPITAPSVTHRSDALRR
jgi:glycosyltransferase involved in cell wall biosynthesis